MISILNDLYKLKFVDFDINNIDVAKVVYETTELDYTVTPRKQNLLHYMIDGEREYQINGKKFILQKNSAIFIPHNTRYKTRALVKSKGIGIRFDGDIFKDEKDLEIYYKSDKDDKAGELFEKAYQIQNIVPCEVLSLKITVLKIIKTLIETEIPEEYTLIKDAVDFININYRENLPVKAYADKCNLSESYFRKKFKEFFAKSPVEYRNELRFAEAKRLYRHKFSTEKIAETIGFCDAGYMLKLYKRQTGKSFIKDAEII